MKGREERRKSPQEKKSPRKICTNEKKAVPLQPKTYNGLYTKFDKVYFALYKL